MALPIDFKFKTLSNSIENRTFSEIEGIFGAKIQIPKDYNLSTKDTNWKISLY